MGFVVFIILYYVYIVSITISWYLSIVCIVLRLLNLFFVSFVVLEPMDHWFEFSEFNLNIPRLFLIDWLSTVVHDFFGVFTLGGYLTCIFMCICSYIFFVVMKTKYFSGI